MPNYKVTLINSGTGKIVFCDGMFAQKELTKEDIVDWFKSVHSPKLETMFDVIHIDLINKSK